jgi:prepilin-type N-terminal cleavage/methylation domain-containing protein
MRYCAKTKGFSTVEVLTVIAILAILASILLGVGKRLQAQAEEKLARSMIDILVSALEQYYDYHGVFPFNAGFVYGEADFEDDVVDTAAGDTVVLTNGTPPDPVIDPDHGFWSSSALYYFLSRTPPSRQIIETLTDRLISSKDLGGDNLIIEITIGSNPAYQVDLIRFIDPWGKSIQYTYSGDNFPLIVCAGPDGEWDTGDEIDSR